MLIDLLSIYFLITMITENNLSGMQQIITRAFSAQSALSKDCSVSAERRLRSYAECFFGVCTSRAFKMDRATSRCFLSTAPDYTKTSGYAGTLKPGAFGDSDTPQVTLL